MKNTTRLAWMTAAACAALAGGLREAQAQSTGALEPRSGESGAQRTIAPASIRTLVIDGFESGEALEAMRTWNGDDQNPASTVEGRPLDRAWVENAMRQAGVLGHGAVLPDQVTGAVLQLNRALLANGYVNSGFLVAEQNWPPANGELRLQWVRGALDDVHVNWGAHGARGLTQDYVVDRLQLSEDEAFNSHVLERRFRLLADDPALESVNASIRPTGQGRAALDVIAHPKPQFDLFATYANNRSPSVGGERAAIGGSARNLLLSGSLLSAEVGSTEGLLDAALAYAAPISPHTSVLLRGDYNDASVVDPALAALDIESTSYTVEVGLNQVLWGDPLAPRPVESGVSTRWDAAQRLAFGVRLAQRHSETTLMGVPFSFSPGAVDGKTDVTVARFIGDWSMRGVFGDDNPPWQAYVAALSLTYSVGLDGSGSDIVGVDAPDRNFQSAMLQASYAQRLLPGAENKGGLELRVRLAGQWASGLMYTAERFAVGGSATVRGYRENAVLADSGAYGSVELALPLHNQFGWRGSSDWNWSAVTIAAFVDAATFQNEGGPATQVDSISSYGVSLAWDPSPGLHASVTFAEAQDPLPTAGPKDLQDDGVHFRVEFRPLEWFRDR